jgi:hypothetical protein
MEELHLRDFSFSSRSGDMLAEDNCGGLSSCPNHEAILRLAFIKLN